MTKINLCQICGLRKLPKGKSKVCDSCKRLSFNKRLELFAKKELGERRYKE